MKIILAGMRSWKTTAIGLLTFGVALGGALIAQLDETPETVPNWDAVVNAGIAALALLMARDADISSEQTRRAMG